MFSTGAVNECLYQVQLQTVPGNGLYEASVSFHDGKYRVIGDISRINLYGEQPRCLWIKGQIYENTACVRIIKDSNPEIYLAAPSDLIG